MIEYLEEEIKKIIFDLLIKNKDISKICLNVEKTGLDALKTIESGGCQIALITDKDSKLLGTISDGDIRRFLIHGNSLDEKVSTIMNKKFIFLEEGEKHKGFELMRRERINQIPILDSTGVILEILLLKDLIKIPTRKSCNHYGRRNWFKVKTFTKIVLNLC